MSVDTMHEDPWAGTETAEPPAEDAITDEFDEFDDILAGLEEEESSEAIRVPSSARIYANPLDVGLKDKQWVPLRILTAQVEPKHKPRLSSKTCVAELNGKKFLLFEQVEAALRAGGTEEIRDDVRLPYFVCTANHASDEFQRRYPYEIEVPVFTIKTALFKAQGNRTGYANEKGRSLRLATGATSAGDKVSKENWDEVAAKMEEVVVLAQLSISQSKKSRFRPVRDAAGQPVLVKVNPEDGTPVTVFSPEDGTGYIVEGSGEVWEGDEKLLFPLPGQPNRFAITDDSDLAAPLQEEYFPINDYIDNNAPFLPLPERKVVVDMVETDEEGNPKQVEGEITLDTVGAIAKGAHAGATVDVFLKTGQKVTAVWLGTLWQELRKDTGENGGLSEFAGADPVSQL